jgi:hypothetical protein
MRDVAGDEHEIKGTIADHLVGDVDSAAAGVSRLRKRHLDHSCPFRSRAER